MNFDRIRISRNEAWILGLLVVVGIVLRLFGDVANLQPIAAIALFGGFFFSSRLIAMMAIVTIMLVTDWATGALGQAGTAYPWPLLATVYICFLLPVVFGKWIDRDPNSYGRLLGKVSILSIACSLIFFAVTNFAMWGCTDLYPKSLAGLGQCYVAGLPFLKAPLAADFAFSIALFSSWFAVTQTRMASLRERLSFSLRDRNW